MAKRGQSVNALIDVRGLKEFRKAMKEAGADLSDLSEVNKRIAKRGADLVRSDVPSKSGKLRSSVKGKGTRTFAEVRLGNRSTPYARVQEHGPAVPWRSQSGQYVRVPIQGNIRMLRRNAILLRGGKFSVKGFFFGPSLEKHRPELLEEYIKQIDETLERYLA